MPSFPSFSLSWCFKHRDEKEVFLVYFPCIPHLLLPFPSLLLIFGNYSYFSIRFLFFASRSRLKELENLIPFLSLLSRLLSRLLWIPSSWCREAKFSILSKKKRKKEHVKEKLTDDEEEENQGIRGGEGMICIGRKERRKPETRRESKVMQKKKKKKKTRNKKWKHEERKSKNMSILFMVLDWISYSSKGLKKIVERERFPRTRNRIKRKETEQDSQTRKKRMQQL